MAEKKKEIEYRVCAICGKKKPITEYYKSGRSYLRKCKKCKLKKTRKAEPVTLNRNGFVYWFSIVNTDEKRIEKHGKTEVLAGPFESLRPMLQWHVRWRAFWESRYGKLVMEKEDRSHWVGRGGRNIRYN